MHDEYELLKAQQHIHELIAEQHPLEDTLDAIAHWLSLLLPSATIVFMRHDPDEGTLSLVPSKHFSQSYIQRLQAVPIGPGVASFGTSAFERRIIITEDITTDPRWEGLREAAMAEGLRACWSSPVVTANGELLGTFDTYYSSPEKPTVDDKRRLRQAAALIALALIRDRDIQAHRTLSEWHHSLFVNHPDGVYSFDLEGRFQSGNAALERITGYSEADLVGLHFNQFITPDYRDLTQAAFDTARQGEAITYETMGTHASGHPYYLEITNFPVIIDGEIVGVYGICRDITQRKQQTDELRLLKRGVDASPNGVLMVDACKPDMPIAYANPIFSTMTGYGHEEIIGINCRFLQGPETDLKAVDAIRHGIRDQRDVEVTLLNYRKDGTPFWNQLVISPVFDDRGTCTHFIGIQQDVTRQKGQDARIAYQASHDLLTGLPNRTAFDARLSEAFHYSQQHQKLLAVMYLDMDGFKTLNDGLGHHLGNKVLAKVATRLHALVSEGQTLGRLVGDEFGLLLTGCDSHEQVVELADRILETLATPFEVDDHCLHISVSIGIACNDITLDQPHELMQHADLALEKAKRQGRNTWQWYRDREVASIKDSVLLRHDLHTALHEEQFELYYQPLVETTSGRVCGVEALVRWHHPSRGLITPYEFISLAERTGQIIPLGRWVLRQACLEMAQFRTEEERILPVAVNISSLQFHRDGFLDEVRRILEETGLPPNQLELEVTESVFLDGASQVIDMMETLKAIGVRVAIDDFGTGFSSLSYLRDLPTHKVKLDRSFIADTLSDPRSAAIVQGVITMAHHMEMMVVAEGIETEAQQQDMVRRHCDLLQGYRFARPMPLAELRSLPERLPAKGFGHSL
ncbi:sensor domain-containing phosphodiesterase [Aidingimonas lacisalsi]|uniref:sensor domain-containing phosphodiesterase n=1 Tax=Aidingimonas lacisalsi TaxID=2604086 RepID=UPI0011D20E62|nr:EAL domain-containing protein [Aidingimonas lacisalsi]